MSTNKWKGKLFITAAHFKFNSMISIVFLLTQIIALYWVKDYCSHFIQVHKFPVKYSVYKTIIDNALFWLFEGHTKLF